MEPLIQVSISSSFNKKKHQRAAGFSNIDVFVVIGMAGLAVTYGLNLNGRLSRWILSFCKLENKIISIERIYQYSQILGEAPAIIEDFRPPSSWPETGTIELLDVKVLFKNTIFITSLHFLSLFSNCFVLF